eukprot:gene771-546_t
MSGMMVLKFFVTPRVATKWLEMTKASGFVRKKLTTIAMEGPLLEWVEEIEGFELFLRAMVINRFHEVYSSSSKRRLVELRELFADTLSIVSLFHPTDRQYLQGCSTVTAAYLKSPPTPTAVSKRVYVELPSPLRRQWLGTSSSASSTESAAAAAAVAVDGDAAASATSAASMEVTFICDFHRLGTMPGLGDGHRPTVLVYACRNAQIQQIWGAVDTENVSQPEDLSFEANVVPSRVWQQVRRVILDHPFMAAAVPAIEAYARQRGVPVASAFESMCCHFHNYDRMEVWGLM